MISSATDAHPAAIDPEVLAAECEFRATRRSGPGGQNRNKVETAVILTHRPTGISAQASERRTRARTGAWPLTGSGSSWPWPFAGRSSAARTNAFVPSALWRSRCRGGRIVVNPEHEDFPALLAEALDVLHASDDEPKAAAEALGCSPSQLIKLLKEEPRALAQINERRRQAGRHPFA